MIDNRPRKPKGKAALLGLGLDNEDGHQRLTTGENFAIIGGSQDTHEFLQEKCVKFNESLKRRSKPLEAISPEEFHDIAQEIGLKKGE